MIETNINIDEVTVKKVRGRWRVTPETKLGSFRVPEMGLGDYLFRLIKGKGPMTRGQLSKLTNIPRTTLYDYIIEFVRSHALEKFPVGNRKRGRPPIFYRVSEEKKSKN